MAIMDRDHRLDDPNRADQPAGGDVARRDAASEAQPPFRYATHDEAMSVAERMMEKYNDVLRELAK